MEEKKPDLREYTQYDSNYKEKSTSLICDNRKRILETLQKREGVVSERRHVRVLFGY